MALSMQSKVGSYGLARSASGVGALAKASFTGVAAV